MNWNPDVTRLGLFVVAIILSWSGIYHMIEMELYGKVRMPGATPFMEGGSVFMLGLVEVVIGLFCLYRAIRHS